MRTEYQEPPEYLFDTRLKPERDFPGDLPRLLDLFRKKRREDLSTPHKLLKDRFRRGIGLIEETFREWFLSASDADRISLAERINRRLRRVSPMLLMNAEGAYVLGIRIDAKNPMGENEIWEMLAQVITGLDRRLVHECPYCQKVFISKQRKKFHPQCRVKYLSEKYRESGKAKWNLQRFRAKQKKKAEMPKKPN